MLFYIVIFIFCIIMWILNCKIKNKKIKIIISLLTLMILCLISGTRYYLGGEDYYIYMDLYNSIPKITDINIMEIFKNGNVEISYVLVNSIIKSLGINFFGFTLIHSCFFYFATYKGFYKKINNFNFFLIIFLYKLFFYNTFISMRQSIAIAIFFLSLKYIINKKYIKYCLCCLIAITFHKSAIILFIVCFISKIKINKKAMIIIFIIFFVLYLLNITGIFIYNPNKVIGNIFNDNISTEKINWYFGNNNKSGLNIFYTFEYFFIYFLILIGYDRMEKKEKNFHFCLNMFILMIPIFTVFRSFGIAIRMDGYFTWTYAIFLYYFQELMNKRYRILFQILVISIYFYGYIRYIIIFDSGGLMPYNSFIFEWIKCL